MKEFIKSRVLFLLLGVVISGFVYVYAEGLSSSDIIYDNSNSTLQSTDLESAINELAGKLDGGGGAHIYYLGTGTSFNIKSRFPNIYSTLTANNFIIGTNGAPSASTSYYSDNVYHATSSAYTGFGLSKSYNSSTGILSIGGNSYTLRTCIDSSATYCNDARTTGSATVFAYLVVGTIE